jgi:hypothetical protein
MNAINELKPNLRNIYKMTDECLELKNIKYHTMLLNGNNKNNTYEDKDVDIATDSHLEAFLEKEKAKTCISKPWNKLDKIHRIHKLNAYADVLSTKHGLNEKDTDDLKKYLRTCLNRKRLQRMQDVIYDKVEGVIKNIPGLHHKRSDNRFTLRHTDKKKSTLKNLGGSKKLIEKGLLNKNSSKSTKQKHKAKARGKPKLKTKPKASEKDVNES